jgi:mannose-6-phosphate isomerase-like protein (cupin superfamily)
VVKPGASLSLQYHQRRSEHWVVVSGTAKVVNGEHEITIGADQSSYIPAGTAHRLANPGEVDCVMIEVQSGDYLGEDDIVRLDDHYGRK